MPPIDIAFAGVQEQRRGLPIAAACGIGAGAAETAGEDRFQELLRWASQALRVTTPEESRLIVYPHGFAPGEHADAAATLARRLGLPCLFFHPSDEITPFDIPHGMLYRCSIDARRQRPRERAMPAMVDDLRAEYAGDPAPRPWRDVPSVGFCGYVGTALARTLHLLTGRLQKRRGLVLRRRATAAIARSGEVSANLILRAEFLGAVIKGRQRQSGQLAEVRRQFLQSIFESDYTLCLRGKGNYSFRFYETLSAGRIPVFIDTHCVLPFADRIDWRAHCCWVEAGDIGRLPRLVRAFHDKLGPEGFAAMQARNRLLWEQWLSPAAFHRRAFADALGGGTEDL